MGHTLSIFYLAKTAHLAKVQTLARLCSVHPKFSFIESVLGSLKVAQYADGKLVASVPGGIPGGAMAKANEAPSIFACAGMVD